ncbi:MAG: aminopeptidase P family protein [Lachnospiraceae bacterium]|nr:aminopeptidase P family protein [Lachnospiraceae bacterium]
MIVERLNKLREQMRQKQIDVYMIPTEDFHESEYVGDYFKVRKYMSGFTGSAGTLVVTLSEAGLWTDGRYFIQAENQLKGTGIDLYKMGEPKVPTVEEFIKEKTPEHGWLGFDGRVVNALLGIKLKEALEKKDAKIDSSSDLVDAIWEDRPAISKEPAYLLDIKWVGKPRKEKLSEIREVMEEKKADSFILTSLDDIAWLLNIRGNDVTYNPVVLSYVIVRKEECLLFIQPGALSEVVQKELEQDAIKIYPYHSVYQYIRAIPETETVLLSKKRVNYAILSGLKEGITIIDEINPTTTKKAIKNKVELENLRKSHIKDGVAVTKFMYWLKHQVGKEEITEISAADYLEGLRKEQEGFLELSFDTISAYQANAAMMHYSATPEHNAKLKPEGFLLVDSGGQYYEGTTDITRTFVLGPIPDEWKKHYTLVAKSMLNLANVKFLYGCNGLNLDILARGPLWNIGIDYRCGTGHGVGYLLNVHEGPNGFRWKHVPERDDQAVFEEGMVTTDEPGVYIENSHGIRTENELICKKAEKNEYGQFMEFETITYAPIDLDGIDVTYFSETDKMQLNQYHKMVYEKISPYLTKEEADWLKEYTREI